MHMVLVHTLDLCSLTSKAGCLKGRQAAAEEVSDISNIAPQRYRLNIKGMPAYPKLRVLIIVSPNQSPQHYGIRSDPVGMYMLAIIDVTHGKSNLL